MLPTIAWNLSILDIRVWQSDRAFITTRQPPKVEFVDKPNPFLFPFASDLEPPPLVFPWSNVRISSGGSSHGSSSNDSGNNNINGNNPSNHSNNDANNPSGPVLQPIPMMAIFDNELDHVLKNLCNYEIDDADDVLNKLFNDNMVASFCQFCNTPASEIGLWKIRRDDGSFTPIIRNVQMSLSNVLYYASTLEDTASNNPP